MAGRAVLLSPVQVKIARFTCAETRHPTETRKSTFDCGIRELHEISSFGFMGLKGDGVTFRQEEQEQLDGESGIP